jgi:hypothetical protein
LSLSFFIGLTAALIGILVNIPMKVIPVCVIGSVALSEFYYKKHWALMPRLLLVLISSISIAIVAVSFTHNTVFYLSFDFNWQIHWCGSFGVL